MCRYSKNGWSSTRAPTKQSTSMNIASRYFWKTSSRFVTTIWKGIPGKVWLIRNQHLVIYDITHTLNRQTVGLNEYSDLTHEEFSIRLGAPQHCSATNRESFVPYELPARKDWRKDGNYVTHVKNQVELSGSLSRSRVIHKSAWYA